MKIETEVEYYIANLKSGMSPIKAAFAAKETYEAIHLPTAKTLKAEPTETVETSRASATELVPEGPLTIDYLRTRISQETVDKILPSCSRKKFLPISRMLRRGSGFKTTTVSYALRIGLSMGLVEGLRRPNASGGGLPHHVYRLTKTGTEKYGPTPSREHALAQSELPL